VRSHRDSIANPEDMTKEEWELWHRYKCIFSSLLEDLKRDNMLKHSNKMPKNFLKLIEDGKKFNKSYNMMQRIFDEKGKSKRFVEHNKDEFGITEEDLPYLFVSQAISSLITNAEFFKNTMITILRMEKGFHDKMTVGALLSSLAKLYPKQGTTIKNEIDTDLRNALVHGTFWIDGKDVLYCKDMKLENPKSIGLDELLIKVKDHNIIAQCFLWLIGEKASKGFFV
jgi:hypothetical protein